jgi:GDPmannose 4,6-dehydratase
VDYVISTGVTTSVREFIKLAFSKAGIEIEFKGSGVDEKAFIKSIGAIHANSVLSSASIGKCVVEVDPRYFRPTEVELLIGDSSKAQKALGWKPRYTLEMLVEEMIASDMKHMEREKALRDLGHESMRYYE